MALVAYRNLLRAARIAFEGDANVLSAAKESIRNGFRDKRSLSASDPEVQASLQHAQDVAQFLRSNVVQGRKDGDVYRLRIHKDTERGDNDTIKLGNKTIKVDGQKCCSS
ncbi:putative zinc maintenance protein 1, mitochondrial [Coniochaeta pulveracea]|uniref:Mitochondrial zinc maintenance protein 1, mitochondrial n=1 Tax=Coniochaeta pulveracea TaxID=177199 RepID=A0A420Y410_9PEZI|nr:putative zinc maintenance protein 1, mitochondrial [Coniochaeta pulveracea]